MQNGLRRPQRSPAILDWGGIPKWIQRLLQVASYASVRSILGA